MRNMYYLNIWMPLAVCSSGESSCLEWKMIWFYMNCFAALRVKALNTVHQRRVLLKLKWLYSNLAVIEENRGNMSINGSNCFCEVVCVHWIKGKFSPLPLSPFKFKTRIFFLPLVISHSSGTAQENFPSYKVVYTGTLTQDKIVSKPKILQL